MNPIALPTSPETRAALEKAGWYLLDPRLLRSERWYHNEPNGNILLCDDAPLPIIGDNCDFLKALEFAAILGIAPKGNVLALVEVVEKAQEVAEMCDEMWRLYTPAAVQGYALALKQKADVLVAALAPFKGAQEVKPNETTPTVQGG